jgi:hypothetical protein
MPVIAIYALIAAIVFGSGYGTCWKVMNQQVATLNAQIEVSNADAKRRLLESVAATEKAERDAAEANVQLENEHAKNMQLVSDNSTALSNVRMRIKTVHTNCSSPVPEGTSTGVPTDTTDTTELPEDFEGLLRQKSAECDKVAVYANEAYKFVSNHCEVRQ